MRFLSINVILLLALIQQPVLSVRSNSASYFLISVLNFFFSSNFIKSTFYLVREGDDEEHENGEVNKRAEYLNDPYTRSDYNNLDYESDEPNLYDLKRRAYDSMRSKRYRLYDKSSKSSSFDAKHQLKQSESSGILKLLYGKRNVLVL